MNNNIFKKLMAKIKEEQDSFISIVEADNSLGLNVTMEDILNYMDFTNGDKLLNGPVVGNILITEGDILSILKIIHDIVYLEGSYTLFINNDNIGINTYLVTRSNEIFQELNINVNLVIDYSDNYNKYLNSLVTLVGSENFLKTASQDFTNANQLLV